MRIWVLAKKKKSSKGNALRGYLLLIMGLMTAIVFLPTTFLLIFALLPTTVAAFVDRSKRKTKAMTVGAMNLAGAAPFVLELWMHGNKFDKAVDIIIDPKAIIVIYAAAAVGYLIDWSMTGIIANVLVQRGHQRKKDIIKRQKELISRWGEEVTGDVMLDEHGFRLEPAGEPDEGV